MITVYSGPNCGLCTATKNAFYKAGTEFTERHITQEEREAFGARGHRSLPIVTVERDGETIDEWAGLRLDKINEWRDAA